MNKCFFLPVAIVLALLFSTVAFANIQTNNATSAVFFVSNNTKQIDLQIAFNRLRGEEQHALQNETIKLMQKEHLEQGLFEDLLGTYKMAEDQKITADNSERIITSAYQTLSPETAFKIAQALANAMNQESIAVFIPSEQSKTGDTILQLKSKSYTISEIIEIIREKLPKQYSQAFSLHLNNNHCSNFNNSTVKEVEWLGSRIHPAEIKKSFPQEEVAEQKGDAYLVYKTGNLEKI